MDNVKTNDMLLSTLSNPEAKTLDFINNGVTTDNTQLLGRDEYKNKSLIKEQFTNNEGTFNDDAFNYAYEVALNNFNAISNESAFNNLDEVEYEFYDWTRPMASKVRAVDIKYGRDYNHFQTLYNRDHFGSTTENKLSLREIAQRGRVHDLETNTWSEQSVNELSLFDKFFGDTLVYAQWDEDGVHEDPETKQMVRHSAGDWKVDSFGQLYVEKIGNREIYGKQVVNPTDILTTDGSIFNKFDFLDSDGREKSIGKIAAKTIIEIAPLLIPGFNTYYGGMKAAVGLATVMPTFLKSFEGMLLGDSKQYGDDPITKAENWMYKYRTPSTSDSGSESMWNAEQMAEMVTGIFSQIYEQRAMAGLSKYLMRPNKLLDTRAAQLQATLSHKAKAVADISGVDTSKALETAVRNLPELQKAFAKQSALSKGLSLGYMALSSTSEIYGEALAGGFDRRSAGFASLLAAGGQYGLMMNNRMGDWFLDKTTGYTTETNKALMKKSVQPWLKEINDIFTDSKLTKEGQKVALAGIVRKFSTGSKSFFKGPSVLGEAMLKNAAIEGVEEVTEELVQDMSKGVLDVMSYLGLTKKKGSFQTLERFQTGEFFEDYLANFVGGVLGGGLFELEATRISPWIRSRIQGKPVPKQTIHSIYELVANGHKDDLINIIRKESPKLTNQYLSYMQDIDSSTSSKEESDFLPKDGTSQADLVSKSAIEMIEHLEGILGSEGLILTDEQIINKAIGNELKIDAFNKLKVEGKHVGIEGLLLEDFKRTAYEAADLKTVISDYENASEDVQNTSDITLEKDKLKEKMKEVKSILEGERNMEYFNMMTIALNPDVQRTFGALDRYNYIKAKYKLDYNTLPEDGTDGLTKELADQEWTEFSETTNLLEKLKEITRGFVDLEVALNAPIAKTIESGYYDIRRVSQKDFLNLERTIKSFNVATSSAERQTALNNFIAINKYLESTGAVKVLPWESYRTDLGEKIFNEGLIKKQVVEDDGSISTIDYTAEELGTVLGEGKTLKDIIIENINNVVGTLPTNPLDINLVIAQYNAQIAQNNEALRAKIVEVENSDSDPDTKEKEIKFYQSSISDSFIAPITESRSRKAYDSKHYAKHKAEIDVLTKDNQKDIDKYIEALPLKNSYSIDGKLVSFKELIEIHGATDGDWKTLTDAGKEKLLEQLTDMGIFEQVVRSMDNVLEYRDLVENYADALENRQSTVKIDTDFEQGLFDRIADNIDSVTGILGNGDIKNKVDKINKLEKAYKTQLAKEMPDMFKMHNYAFDFLVSALKSGHYDNEMYLEAKRMFEEEIKSLSRVTFPEADYISIDTVNDILNTDVELDVLLTDLMENSEFDLEDTFGEFMENFEEELKEGYVDKSKENLLLKTILTNNFNKNAPLQDIVTSLALYKDNMKLHHRTVKSLTEFSKLGDANMVGNPIYDMLREFNLQMDSNPKSKVNTIFDIAQREESLYKASSGADKFISERTNARDLQQAINTIDMFNTVVNSMSTTQRYGDDFNGFLAMRQDFAKKYDIKDPILSLKTINSDQAAVMSRDLQVLKTRLEFIKALAEENYRNIANEFSEVGKQADKAHIELFRDLEGVRNLTPVNFKDILNTELPDDDKIMQLETAFYDHNKERKNEAFKDILKYHLKNVQSGSGETYTRETTSFTMSPQLKANYFATVLNVRSQDYLKRQRISLEGEFNKAPFYLQEYVSKMNRATFINPEMFASIFEIKQDKTKDMAEYITFILGGTGTGKTTVTAAQTLDIIRQTNDNSNVWLAGPTMEQANKLHKDTINAIGDKNLNLSTLDTNKLFSLLGDGIQKIHSQIKAELANVRDPKNELVKLDGSRINFEINPEWASLIDYNNLPNLLVFDEVTHLSKPEILLLNFVSKMSHQNGTGNFFKVVGTGDTSQLGYQVSVGNQRVEYNIGGLNSIFTPYMTASVRSDNDQKRRNADMTLGLVKKANELYNLESRKEDWDYARADAHLYKYLTDVNNETGLSYFMDDTKLRGDYISDSYDNVEALKSIKGDIDAKTELGEDIPVVSVLTADGVLNPNLVNTLIKAGFTQDYIKDNIRVHTLANVQGSESDYFLFDMDILPEYDKLRDTLKAFYTYTMRSRAGTIIYDTNGKLKTSLNITNAPMSENAIEFNVLSEKLVGDLKEERISRIKEIAGDGEVSEEGNFIWKSGKIIHKSQSGSESDTPGGTQPGGTQPGQGIRPPVKTTQIPAKEEKNIKKRPISEFKAMVHSFIHNPNAEVTMVDGIARKLTVDNSPVKMDLNGQADINVAMDLFDVMSEWGSLKQGLLRNHSKSIKVSEYPNFFKHIFGNNTSNIEVEYVTTAKTYDEKTNSPILLHTNSTSGALKSGDLLRTLSAKLTVGTGKNQKVHYVTLATFPSAYTLENKGMLGLEDADKHKHKILSGYTNANVEISKRLDALKAEGKQEFLVTGQIDSNDIEIITSTLLVGDGKVSHPLNRLKFHFPGMNMSEIRIFPNDKGEFTKVINNYTYGEQRTPEQIETLRTGIKIENGQEVKVHEPYSGKPYIVVSYANDIDGKSGTETSARLLPITAKARDIKTLREEIK